MLKVKNKKTLHELAKTTYQANKKRNLLTIFSIFLTSFLIAVVLAVGVSYWNTIAERGLRMQGMDYDIELSEPREDQVEKIRSMDQVAYAGVAVKCAVLEAYEGQALDKVRLFWLDEICWEKQTIPALESYEGEYPKEKNELFLAQSALRAMGISEPKVGMKLLLSYTSLGDEESGQAPLEQEFVLSGFYKDYSGKKSGYVSKAFLEETGVKQTDLTQGSLKITLKSPLYFEQEITDMQAALDLDRYQSIDADYDTILNFCKMAAGLAVLLCLIFLSGYLFIYNTLYISISKDIRYYGQLKTVGMTSVQLKRLVYQQALWNGAIGLPLGLLAAAMTGNLLIPHLLHLVNPLVAVKEVAPVRVWTFLLAGAFAFFTNMMSSKKPADMAGDCSPIEALRYTPDQKQRKPRKRERAGIYDMAMQNIFRDKKQAFVIFLSFIIATSIFLVVNVVIRENDARLVLNEVCTEDIQFKNETTLETNELLLTEEKIAQTKSIEGVKYVRRVTSTEVVIPYQEEVYGAYYKALYASRYSPGNYEEDIKSYQEDPNNPFFRPRLISVDKRGFEILNESLGNVLEEEDFEKGKTAVAIQFFVDGDYGMAGKNVTFSLPNEAEEHQVQIAAVGDAYSNPAFFAGGYTPDLIVSEAYAASILGDLYTELIDVEYEKAFSEETEEQVKAVWEDEKQISHTSKLELYADMKNAETQIKVLGSSIGLLIAMLAVLNYINMMAASIQNRAREFATLESIGMTTRQLQKMLQAEGIGYGVISSIISLVIGLPASYAVFHSLNTYQVSFSIPWVSNLALLGSILILCMTMPILLYRKTQKDSILERMR